MADKGPPRQMAKDGWASISKGWKPSVTPGRGGVQGGYIPTTGQGAATPPTGGSGVKPPPVKK